MDTSRQLSEVVTAKSQSLVAPKRQRRSIAEKRRIVEETLIEGASGSTGCAGAWGQRQPGGSTGGSTGEKLYQAGRLGGSGATPLLPVRITRESSPRPTISLAVC